MEEKDLKNEQNVSAGETDTATDKAMPGITELEALRKERDEYLNGWQRTKADFANAKKRMDETMSEYRTMANENMIEELLPVLQSFEMAFSNKEAWEKADKNWRGGVEYIYNQLKSVVEQNGLKEISAMGEKFDHSKHDAVKHEPVTDAKKENIVVGVIEKGYMLGNKLIKPAKVVVGEYKAV